MFCLIVYFNGNRTDFLVYGPYQSYEHAERSWKDHIKKLFSVERSYQIIKMMEGQ